MTRPLRIEFKGAVYHITSRGNARQAIFLDEEDFADFLFVLCQAVKRYHFILHAFCLMNNHYHLLIDHPLWQFIKRNETIKWSIYLTVQPKTPESRAFIARQIQSDSYR